MAKTQTIEVDEVTAAMLKARAAEHGVSVSELLARMTALQDTAAALSPEDVAELDRQWASVKAGEPTVSHEEVVRWMKTWGTPAFRPWHKR